MKYSWTIPIPFKRTQTNRFFEIFQTRFIHSLIVGSPDVNFWQSTTLLIEYLEPLFDTVPTEGEVGATHTLEAPMAVFRPTEPLYIMELQPFASRTNLTAIEAWNSIKSNGVQFIILSLKILTTAKKEVLQKGLSFVSTNNFC